MTKDEAIKIFEYYQRQHDRGMPVMVTKRDIVALDMAIEALSSAERKGHWITKVRHEHYPSGKAYETDFCSVCGQRGSLEYPYCPNCGARMVSEE